MSMDRNGLSPEHDQVRKHLITEHGVLDADELADALAYAEHYSQHFSSDGGRTPAKGTWGHPFNDLAYNQDLDLEVT